MWMEIKFTALDLSHSICKYAPCHASLCRHLRPWVCTLRREAHTHDNRCYVMSYLVNLRQVWRGILKANWLTDCLDVASEAEVNFYKQIYTFHFAHVFNIHIHTYIFSKKICKLSVLMMPRHSCYIPCMQMLCDTKLKVNSLKIPS